MLLSRHIMYSKTYKSSEVRKIQLTGGSTYTVSLPKKWITEHGLEAKDEIRIEWRPSGALRVIADTSNLLRTVSYTHLTLPTILLV